MHGDRTAARARKGSPLPGTLTLCPLMHGGGFWLAFSTILSGSYCVLESRLPGSGGPGALRDPRRRRAYRSSAVATVTV